MSSSSWNYGAAAPTSGTSGRGQRSGSGDRQKKPQSRQLLSCTKCRERKVKCDRTKPCSACCARGHPKECEFVVGEGNDYSPIQQSYEIRKLRLENLRLKERLQQARLTGSAEDDEDDDLSDRKRSGASTRASATRQRRFRTGERVDNLYFGTPGLANIVQDFANLQFGTHSLTHNLPRGRDMYAPPDGPSAYPFPILWSGGNGASDLAKGLLTSHALIFECLEMFQRRAQSCYFPHTPDEVTTKEVERFLADVEGNAEKFPDMLALIFATVATGMQMGVYDKYGGWEPGVVESTRITSDVYLAASMQALRLASFMNTPTLLSIQTLIIIGPYLTNSGRFLDAWTLFGTTIRLAQSIGLHRDPKFLDPSPPLREATIRRTIWWWMLHMDQQYSVTLGRPLGISGIGDCPPAEPLTTNPTILRLSEFIDHFTILSRQILASDGMMNVGKIDDFTDKLIGLWDTMPEALQFNESWLQQETCLPEWPLEVMSATLYAKVQSFLILINRQRLERTQGLPTSSGYPPGLMMPPLRPLGQTPYDEHSLHEAPTRGRALVIHSSTQLLQAFMFFWHRNPACLICWTMGQQAFNACMILILDAWETDNYVNMGWVEHAFAVFNELQIKGVHKLAELAVQRISHGLAMLGQRQHEREHRIAARSVALGMRQQQQGVVDVEMYTPTLQIETASMSELTASDGVMGSTGMVLLEDPGLQSYAAPAFESMSWNIAGGGGSAHPSNTSNSNSPTPGISSPTIPISRVNTAPFPDMSSSFEMAPTTCGTMLPAGYGHMLPTAATGSRAGTTFTPINTAISEEQMHPPSFPQLRAHRHIQRSLSYTSHGSSAPSWGGTHGNLNRPVHRIERPTTGIRSQQRRK